MENDFGATDFMLLLGAVVLCVVVLSISDLLARNAQTRGGQIAGLVWVLVLAAFFPAVVSLVYLLFESFGANRLAFWSIAPWLMTAVVVRFGGYFFIGSVLGGIAYVFSSGGHREKWTRLQFVLSILVVGMCMYVPIVLVKSPLFRH
jgi:hypothetical protein